MLFKTKAIALNYIKYRDTSIIAKCYTREFGMQTYIINRIRVKNPKFKIAHFQPFTLLELVCYHNEKKDIQRISELKTSDVLHRIPFEISRSSIALFLTEILARVLREEHSDKEMFDFIDQSVVKLDQIDTGINFFHIQFLLKLGVFLGMVPENADELLKEISSHLQLKKDSSIEKIQQMIDQNYGSDISLTKPEKSDCFDAVLDLYRIHFDNLREIKSLSVLKSVME